MSGPSDSGPDRTLRKPEWSSLPVQANTLTLKDIFRKDIRYVVPMFQRPYVWNEEEHWQYLWDDLIEVVDDLLDRRSEASAGERDRRTPEQETAPHFLGAMVLDQLSTPTKKLETREIIDGQQRLTTLQVFLAAARDLAFDLDLVQQASLLGKLIYNDDDLTEDDRERLKVWPIRPDQQAFQFVS